jgi:S-formylglutathione hydrolase
MLNLVENNKSFDGHQKVYQHQSISNNCTMRFALYQPDIFENIPVLFFLSGLTCNEQNFIQKSGFQQYASKYKVAVIVPDTSPRGNEVPDSDNSFLGHGAGFYVNANKNPWSKNFLMYDYVTKELPKIIEENFSFSSSKIGIFGHSMGGLGAIQCALKNNDYYKSVSALAPICSLHKSDFAREAMKNYFNNDKDLINSYDPINLIKEYKSSFENIYIDVGSEDEFFHDLFINDFVEICNSVNQKIIFKKRLGYGHNYYFVQSFIKDHIEYHLNILKE